MPGPYDAAGEIGGQIERGRLAEGLGYGVPGVAISWFMLELVVAECMDETGGQGRDHAQEE